MTVQKLKAHSDRKKSCKHVSQAWWNQQCWRSLNFDAPEKIHVAHNGMNIPFKNWSCTAAIICVECTIVQGSIRRYVRISSFRYTLR